MPRPKAYLAEHRIADKHAPKIRRAILNAIADAKKRVQLKPLMIQGLTAIPFQEIENAWSDMFVSVLRDLVEESGKAQIPITPIKKAHGDLARLGFRFDLTNPRAIAWIHQHAGELVLDLSGESMRAIQAIMVRSFQGEFTVAQQAQFIRDLIGLDERRATALDNFRREAFTVDPAKAERKVNQYRQRLLKDRADTIARTESIRGSAQGQQELWTQMLEQGVLDDTARRRWAVTPDSRLCPICSPMPSNPRNTVRLDEPFETGDGRLVMIPPAHPRCRCSPVLVFPPYPPVPSVVQAFAGRSGPPRRRRKPRLGLA